MRDIKFLQTKNSKAAQFKLRQIAEALDQHIPFFFKEMLKNKNFFK
jgi:hypothetical protein